VSSSIQCYLNEGGSETKVWVFSGVETARKEVCMHGVYYLGYGILDMGKQLGIDAVVKVRCVLLLLLLGWDPVSKCSMYTDEEDFNLGKLI
jgi:hypothetical protein